MKKVVLIFASVMMLFAFKPTGEGYNPGDKAMDFKLKNIDGKMVSLADYKNAKGFIVVFTCNHCPFAKKYEGRIVALDKKYKDKGYPVIAINPNDPTLSPEDDYAGMKQRAKDKGFTFPYLVDESQNIARTYGATNTPHVYVLEKERGDLIVKYVGAIDDNSDDPSAVKEKYVENAVDALLSGKTVATAHTKAIGCTIKWRKA